MLVKCLFFQHNVPIGLIGPKVLVLGAKLDETKAGACFFSCVCPVAISGWRGDLTLTVKREHMGEGF